MAALATANIVLPTRAGKSVVREVVAAGTVFGGSAVQSDTNGALNPVSASAGKFEGLTNIGGTILAATVDRKLALAKQGAVLCTITGVTKADLGKPVFAPTDNPADFTKTFTAGAKLIGWIDDLEYDSNGAVANSCYVYFDAFTFGELFIQQEKTSPALIPIAGTVRETFYKVPTGKNAQLYEVNWQQQVKPNFATSATLNLNKITATVRTNLIAGINVNNTGALDTVAAAALTGAFALLAAGDILEAEVVTVGGLTTAGKLNVHANLYEYAKI